MQSLGNAAMLIPNGNLGAELGRIAVDLKLEPLKVLGEIKSNCSGRNGSDLDQGSAKGVHRENFSLPVLFSWCNWPQVHLLFIAVPY